MPKLVSIEDSDSICTLCPSLGGSITSWSVDGQNMLRHADAAAIASGDPLSLASFPLVPFSNRIGYARFVWQQRSIELTPNFAPEPHAIHGTGWNDVWVIAEQSAGHCMLTLRHESDARWPWPFVSSQEANMESAVIYVPKGGSAFCFEPVPHISDALNRPSDLPAMPTVAPGESFDATVRLTAVKV